jgi:hypothetical protein
MNNSSLNPVTTKTLPHIRLEDIKVGDILLDEIDGEVCVVTSPPPRKRGNYQVLVLVSPSREHVHQSDENRKGKAQISSLHIQRNMRLL